MNMNMGLKTTLNVNTILTGFVGLLLSLCIYFFREWKVNVDNNLNLRRGEHVLLMGRVTTLEVRNDQRWDELQRRLNEINENIKAVWRQKQGKSDVRE